MICPVLKQIIEKSKKDNSKINFELRYCRHGQVTDPAYSAYKNTSANLLGRGLHQSCSLAPSLCLLAEDPYRLPSHDVPIMRSIG